MKTPVLFVTFARPDYARQSFDAIKKAKPATLYFYSNKCREDKLDEKKRNDEIRSFVSEVDWLCDVKLFYREEYVDIYTSLRGAIDWVFSNEDEAIVLEEDCVATPEFFEYCEKLLKIYREKQNVWMISGNNFTPKANPEGLSYFATRYMHIYGWAGWADRWHKQDKMMNDYQKLRFSKIVDYYGSIVMALISRLYWNNVYRNFNNYNPWDHIFTYNMIANKAFSIIPSHNLVSDIGLVGTHHNNSKSKNVVIEKSSYKLNVPDDVDDVLKPSDKYDNYHFYHHILFPFIKRKLQRLSFR